MSVERLPIARIVERKRKQPEWREQRPINGTRAAPCSSACPVNTRIPQSLQMVRAGDVKVAWRSWVTENPLPAVMGRICYAPCEENCNRDHFDDSVAIHCIERFIGDYALEHGLEFTPPADRRAAKVACVGSGPASLACAFQLARRGYPVTIFESLPVAGGMLRVGIPNFQLPPEILQSEVERILRLGVELRVNTPVTQLQSLFDDKYEAVFLGVGASQGHRLAISGANQAKVFSGIDFLRRVNLNEQVTFGKHVLVAGGGNVAIDVARTAFRLGAERVDIACLERREAMPAHLREIRAAEEEGIVIHPAQTLIAIIQEGDTISGVRCLDVRTMAFDTNSQLSLETDPNSEHILPCDTVIFATGQGLDTGLLPRDGITHFTPKGGIQTDAVTMTTGVDRVFAGGDATLECGTAARALAHGKQAAESIDAFLRQEQISPRASVELVRYEHINTHYYATSQCRQSATQPVGERGRNRDEVSEAGSTLEIVQAEARRCFSCGVCFHCDNCRTFCPDMAVMKLAANDGYQFEYTYCKGCGICARECPSGTIEMISDVS